MKTINNETAHILREFLDTKKKVDMVEVENIYEHVNSESGAFIYNSELVMADINAVFGDIDRCSNPEKCKYQMCILAIVFEGCGIYPNEASPFYEISNDNAYKFKVLAREAQALVDTKNKDFITAFMNGSFSAGHVAEILINDAIDVDNEDEEELNNVREFDIIYNKIFNNKLLKSSLKDTLSEIGRNINEVINMRYKSRTAKTKLSKDSMHVIYKTMMKYGMISED